MSISVMKQALEALNYIYCPSAEWQDEVMEAALYALRQAIAEAEKQEPVAWRCPIRRKDCTENCGSYGCGN